MNAEFDYDLTPDQWETLKALRLPAAQRRILNRFVVDKGRSVLLRGSPRLWDVAA